MGAHEAAPDLSGIFTVSLQSDDIQDFDTRWDQAPISVREKAQRKRSGKLKQDVNT